MTQSLATAITATQARLVEGIAEAEAELVVARRRCRELRETIALARAREAAATTEAPPRPKVREVRQQARIAQLTDSYLTTAPAGRTIPRSPDRKSTRLNSSHSELSRMPSSA